MKHYKKSQICQVAILALALMLSATLSFGQSVFATLTGVVSDQSQATVPNARIVLKNSASGDIRRTVTNQDGYFTFASVPVGTYEISVEADGFSPYRGSDLSFTGAEKKNINIDLKVGSTTDKVDVVSVGDIVPTDSGEKSATLTQKELQNYAVVGRNAAEFIKIMPGFSIANTGTENRSNFTGETIGINGNGDGGSQSPFNGAYSNNGLPAGSLDITADGAHVSDPGCNCATPVNPNSEMIAEFKVLTSNFSAENSKGPAVVSSIARSGGNEFHGSAYLYARHYSLNANDWLNNKSGQSRPTNKYFFPGGNLSGPVLIPGTNFNKNRDKLFFFTGFEQYFQTLDTGLLRATVPTEGMRNGNFSDAELRKIEGLVRGNWITQSGAAAQRPDPVQFPGGIVPANQINREGQAMMRLLPTPNADPTATGGFNYINQVVFDQNSRQWMSKVDYNISDNTKLFVRYNFQNERQMFPVGLWWRNGNQVPYPTEVVGKNRSDSISTGLTKIFSPTMTNEFVFGFTSIKFPNVFNDPSKVQRSNTGLGNFQGLFKNGVTQIPSITGWGGDLATMFNPGGFEVGGDRGLFADKYLPTFSNNVTKVVGTHTVKAGAFYEFVINNQPANGNTNGVAAFANWAGNTTGSQYSDMLTGRVADYGEQSKNRLNNIGAHIFEFFVQDDWKVNRRLTLNLGFRGSRLGAWYDREQFGFAVFDRSRYVPANGSANFNGFSWFGADKNVRNSGFGTKMIYPAPRVGFAYDLFGTGKTVLRGGWGQFYFQDFQFTVGLDVSAGVRSANIGNTTFADINAARVTGSLPTLASGVDPTDDKRGRTQSYSFTLAQRLPGASILELAYVGNRSDNLLNRNGADNITNGININAVPAGALFRYATPGNLDQAQVDATRPLPGYQNMAITRHMLYQNYNSFQATWIRTKGKFNVNMNYTYGKNLGIVGRYDEFNLRNNYGAMPNDRRHVFNSAYFFELPGIKNGNTFVKGLTNGWQVSGITQIQSGVNITGNTGGNFNLDVNGRSLANGDPISSATVFGTPSIALRPILTCDPSGGGGAQQYINQSCFALPTGRNQTGGSVMPQVVGPAFFNSDLGAYKDFQLSEKKRIQFRVNAYNFLNHPLWTFVTGSANTKLVANQTTGRFDSPVFGIATEKQGRRIMQFAVKFFF